MTLPANTVRAVRCRIAAGQSQREVAAAVAIARTSVFRIVHGLPPHDVDPDDAAAANLEPTPDPEYLAKPARCQGCGALLTQQPCIACGLPPFAPAEAAVDLTEEELGELLGVDLHGGERARYESLRARKQAAGEKPIRPSRRQPAEARFADGGLSRLLESGEIGPPQWVD